MRLANELKNSKKGLINIQNYENKCLLWCHVRHVNPIDKNPQRITKKTENLLTNLTMRVFIFLSQKKLIVKLNCKKKLVLMCFAMKIRRLILFIYPIKMIAWIMDLLFISNEFVSHYVYIKDFDTFMFNKTKNKNKKHFCKSCVQCFSSKNVLLERKKDCLVINGKQNVKLESGFLSFKNYSRQVPAPFKIYADFE